MVLTNESELYNSEIKERFLNTIPNEATRRIALFPLKKARDEEVTLNKDLYEMTKDEIYNVIRDLSCSTTLAVHNNVSKIEEYLMWCARNGYRRTNLSPFPESGERLDWCEQFVSTHKQYSFTKDEVYNMADELVNEVDQAVLLLLFEGARGEKYSEIINLKIEDLHEGDIDEQDYLKLTDHDKSERVVPISKRLAKTLKRANKQWEYINRNGIAEKHSRYWSVEFEDSEYIFKRTKRGKQGGRLDNFFVTRKTVLFKDVFGHQHLKAQHIANSGIMSMAHEFHQKYGEFTVEHARVIGDQYDTSLTSAGGKRYRNVTVIRRIVESEDFKNLYGYALNINF